MHISQLGIQPYQEVWEKMKQFTIQRQAKTEDELWLLEHFPVYTLGQAGKQEHILQTNDIPIVQSDRGGQVTYHGPGQLIAYALIDIRRRQMSIKTLVFQLEQVLINLLNAYQIDAHRQCQAPGVYVSDQKIASIGLRVKAGGSYHGIALNVDVDLEPFSGINPCGYKQLKMTRIKEYHPNITVEDINKPFAQHFLDVFESNDLLLGQ